MLSREEGLEGKFHVDSVQLEQVSELKYLDHGFGELGN